jgi:hypothetical protein
MILDKVRGGSVAAVELTLRLYLTRILKCNFPLIFYFIA